VVSTGRATHRVKGKLGGHFSGEKNEELLKAYRGKRGMRILSKKTLGKEESHQLQKAGKRKKKKGGGCKSAFGPPASNKGT